MHETFRIGVWVTKVKLNKLRIDQFMEFLKPHNIEIAIIADDFCQLLPEIDISKIDFLLYKLSDSILTAKSVEEIWKMVRDFCAKHPAIDLFDNVEMSWTLLNRIKTNELIIRTCRELGCFINCFPSIEAKSSSVQQDLSDFVASHDLKFPLICKPMLCSGASEAHRMTLVFTEMQLAKYLQSNPQVEVSIQRFINHDSCLIKVYVIGTHIFICQRPSVKNFHPSSYPEVYLNFLTPEVSKPNSTSDLIGERTKVNVDKSVMKKLVHEFVQLTQLSLFGMDLIMCRDTRNYYVIDVNHFPGYEDLFRNYPVEYVFEKFLSLFRRARDNTLFPINIEEFHVHEVS